MNIPKSFIFIMTNIWFVCGAEPSANFQLDTSKIILVGERDDYGVSIYYALEQADEFVRKEVPSINLATCERNVWILLKKRQVEVAYTQGLGKDFCSVYLVPENKSFRIVKHDKGKGIEGRPPKESEPDEMIKANERFKKQFQRRNR